MEKSKIAARVALRCPYCGLGKSVKPDELEFMILCPRCGSGMREKAAD